MGCSNYKSGCPSGPVINNPGPQQQIQEAPECHNNQPCKSVCKPRKKRCRGPSRCLSLWDLSDGERIDVSINRFGQPIGREAAKLSSFMGAIARNGYIAPPYFCQLEGCTGCSQRGYVADRPGTTLKFFFFK